MKIIRVTGCHDCSYKFMVLDEYMGCQLIVLEKGGFHLAVQKYIVAKTLPDNCPLEEKEHFVKWAMLHQGYHDVDEFYKE